MPRKKIEVVELNKKEEKIVLEEKKSPLALFWKHNNLLIFLTILILSLTIISVTGIAIIKILGKSESPNIKEVSLDTSLDNYNANITANRALTKSTAQNSFLNNSKFKNNGEVLLLKKIETNKYIIYYYSDITAIRIMKNINTITRIAPLENGNYGIDENGIINSKASTNLITVKETKTYAWGNVTYYSDGSAMINNSKMDMFVRNSDDILDNYISNNKVSYLKETKKNGNMTLNYYYDGTIEIIKNDTTYIVRNENDFKIDNNNLSFPNNNQAQKIETKKLLDGITIYYYQDGSAIISKDNTSISVRKSNSIVIKDNKIYEIVDSQYVKISNNKNGTIYYTNGAAITTINGNTYYVEENSNIKYHNNEPIIEPDNKEILTKETNYQDQNVKIFDSVAIVTTNDYIIIIPKDKVIYDSSGKIKDITTTTEENTNKLKITNNTNERLKYRLCIEQSDRTNVDVNYIRFQILVGSEYISPTNLNNKIWQKDDLYKLFDIQNTNYILIDSTIEPYDTKDIDIMLWIDYETIPNSMQNKYFYGTIKVYAWSEK